jgi:branched-chain amino acid transport system substrate-binding protein
MNKTVKIILGVVIILAIGLVSYGFIRADRENKPDKPIIKIGVILPLTSKGASYGKNVHDGLELALKKIKQDKIVKNYALELVYEDDGLDPKNSVAIFQKFTNIDGIDKIIGPVGSNNAKAIAPLTDNTNLMFITPMCGADDLTVNHNNVFRIWPTKKMSLIPMFDKIARDGYKKIAIITANNDSPLSARDNFVANYKNSQTVQIVFDEKIDDKESDFKTVLMKAKESGADSLFLNLYVGQFGNALKDRSSLGFSLPTFTTATIDNSQDIEAAGSAMEGIWFTGKKVGESWFTEEFVAAYNRQPDQEAATAYDALMVYALAIEKVGNDNGKIRQYLNDFTEYKGASGTWAFDDERNVPLHHVIKVKENGIFKEIQ